MEGERWEAGRSDGDDVGQSIGGLLALMASGWVNREVREKGTKGGGRVFLFPQLIGHSDQSNPFIIIIIIS